MIYAYLLFGVIFSGMVALIILVMKNSKDTEQDRIFEEKLKVLASINKK